MSKQLIAGLLDILLEFWRGVKSLIYWCCVGYLFVGCQVFVISAFIGFWASYHAHRQLTSHELWLVVDHILTGLYLAGGGSQ
jgi:hypothetical protein